MSPNPTTTRFLYTRLSFVLTFLLLASATLAETVNINKASPEAMQEHLTGIGPAKSQAIVDYRRKHGSFKSIDDLRQVPGIGEGTLGKIRGNISLNKGVNKASEGFKPRKQGSTAASSSTDKGGKKATKASLDKEKAKSKSYAGADNGKRESNGMDKGKDSKAKSDKQDKKKEAKEEKSAKEKRSSKKSESSKDESKDKNKSEKKKNTSSKKQSASSKK